MYYADGMSDACTNDGMHYSQLCSVCFHTNRLLLPMNWEEPSTTVKRALRLLQRMLYRPAELLWDLANN